MTELAVVRSGRADSLRSWSDESLAAAAIAAGLAPTPFVPQSLRVFTRGQPDLQATTANIAAALLTGQELGLSPMASLRSIDIVNGTPALRAVALRALAQQYGHDLWVVESTATRCVMRGRRAGSPNEQEVTWTLDRARALGLVGKDNWRKQPTAMLVARATGEIARLVAADAILGLPYVAEELEDGDEQPAAPEIQPAAEPARRTAQRRTRPAVTPAPAPAAPTEPAADDEPPLDDERPEPRRAVQSPHDTPPAAPYVEQLPPNPPVEQAELPTDVDQWENPITKPQLRALQAGFRDLDIDDRAERLAMVSGLIGRDVLTANDLTVAEAGRVLNELALMKAQRQESSDE